LVVEESMNERSNDGYTAPKAKSEQVSNLSEGKADGMSCIVSCQNVETFDRIDSL
jgi:hypothetical protein